MRILLAFKVSVASRERSFSKLKHTLSKHTYQNIIKTYLKNIMGREKFTNLALLNIECKTFMEMNFDDAIKNFALSKAKKY